MDIRTLRGLAHHLDPIVTIGESGATDNAVRELDRALTDHELVKVRLHMDDRAARRAVIEDLRERSGATLVQRIGKVVVLYRANPEARPALSNVARYL
ncbi:MAG: ribosome assembly RNA-binding protein YhbY [Gammaproteobacteria bacterium]|nr:ribosome assembly RNA-binding protein YhbY [Gammaproteobacteria bacterium]